MSGYPMQVVRGDTFRYSFALSDAWLGSSFTGGVWFTIRQSLVTDSTVVTDTGALHQSASTGTSPEITFIGNVGTITIPASVTNTWTAASYYWDLQGVISGTTPVVHTIDSGRLAVTLDVTRRTT